MATDPASLAGASGMARIAQGKDQRLPLSGAGLPKQPTLHEEETKTNPVASNKMTPAERAAAQGTEKQHTPGTLPG